MPLNGFRLHDIGPLLTVVLVAGTAACADAPTSPEALEWLVGGERWVAVQPPPELPTAGSWLAYGPDGEAGKRLARRVALLEARSRSALIEGELDIARAARRAATAAVLEELAGTPRPLELRFAIGALERWERQAAAHPALEHAPALQETRANVRAAAQRATLSLEQGRAQNAVREIATAADEIRAWSPVDVAVRMLGLAEQRALRRAGDVEGSRVPHLITSARRELVSGDPVRALALAVYALQVAEGHEVLEGAPVIED